MGVQMEGILRSCQESEEKLHQAKKNGHPRAEPPQRLHAWMLREICQDVKKGGKQEFSG